MEKFDVSQRSLKHGADRVGTVRFPTPYDGIGNALRSAFDAGNYGVPDDLAELLARLDR